MHIYVMRHCFHDQPKQLLQGVLLAVYVDGHYLIVIRFSDDLEGGILEHLLLRGNTSSW